MKKYFSLIILIIFVDLSLVYASNNNTGCKVVDDLKISNETLSLIENVQGIIYVWGHLFFKNKDNNEIIALRLYTDYHKLEVLIFPKNNIPERLIEHYDFHYKHKQIKKRPIAYIEERIKNAFEIESKYFVTKKGIKLGMNAKKVMQIYGVPDVVEIISVRPQKRVRYKWHVFGDYEKFEEIPKEKSCKEAGEGYDSFLEFLNGKVNLIYFGYEAP